MNEMEIENYNKIAKELINRLAQTVVDYFKENPCEDIDEVAFHFDDIKSSVEFGKWHPYSDGSITLWNWNSWDKENHGRTELVTYM